MAFLYILQLKFRPHTTQAAAFDTVRDSCITIKIVGAVVVQNLASKRIRSTEAEEVSHRYPTSDCGAFGLLFVCFCIRTVPILYEYNYYTSVASIRIMPSKKKRGNKTKKRNKQKPSSSRGSEDVGTTVPELVAQHPTAAVLEQLQRDTLLEAEEGDRLKVGEEEEEGEDKKLPARPSSEATEPSTTEGATTTTTTSRDHQEPPPARRELDEETNRDKFLFRGDGDKLTFERLLKRMPKAAQQLKEGELSSDKLAMELAEAYLRDKANESEKALQAACWEIAFRAWPGSLLTGTERDLRCKFASGILERAVDHYHRFISLFNDSDSVNSKNDTKTAFYDNIVKNLQSDFEKVCRAWSKQLDRKFFNGKTGAFIRWCPIYGLSQQAWGDEYKDLILSSFKKGIEAADQAVQVHSDAHYAASAVETGFADGWTSCWECGINIKDCKICSSCSVARYCGRECQVSAWKGGHKAVCSQHKDVFGKMLENLRVADAAHEAGIVDGFRPSAYQDLHLIGVCVRFQLNSANRYNVLSAFEGPSLSFFYKNVGHIMRGEWWIYWAPDSPEAFKEKNHLSDGDADFETKSLGPIYIALCHDLPGYVASRNGGNVTNEAIEDALGRSGFPLGSIAKMPAELFLKFYFEADKQIDGQYRWGEKRATYMKAKALVDHRKFESSLKNSGDELNSE